MRLYGDDNPAPNPRRVRIYLAEKGLTLDQTRIAMRQGEHKSPAFLEKNTLGQVPVLELDDGTFLSETVSICRYLEELFPRPALFGTTPRGRATVDMWIRRIEFQVMGPIAQIWRHTHPITAALFTQFTEFGKSNRPALARICRWLDTEIAGRDFIAGDTYTMADIVALTTFDFGVFIGAPMPEDCANIAAWHARVSARPSAAA